MSTSLFREWSADAVVQSRRKAVDAEALATAGKIVEDVRARGELAIREYAEHWGEIEPGQEWIRGREAMNAALTSMNADHRSVLDRTAERIRAFAHAQRETMRPLDTTLGGVEMGHDLLPVERAGCYAPGGRYPLPSSVLMTVIPARVAGVRHISVASPKPDPTVLAAAALAGADVVYAVGGAHAIALLALGTPSIPGCDVVVGPGNRWVTAAKKWVAGEVGIDMLAGPSELVVLADSGASAKLVAADLIAQAEHDPEAFPFLVTLDAGLPAKVEKELVQQLSDLPTADVARRALSNGGYAMVDDLEQAVQLIDALAPEHLELLVEDPVRVAERVSNCGAVFQQELAAEVLGDYGAGPNHVLPTGRTSRYRGGLSVLDFLRVRTWMRARPSAAVDQVLRDAETLATLEGLAGHGRAARMRNP